MGFHCSRWPRSRAFLNAGSISRIVTYPADTIKARIQVQGAGEASATYRSAHHALRCVLRVEGPAGLYRGIVPVLAGALPGTMAYYWVSASALGCACTPLQLPWAPQPTHTTRRGTRSASARRRCCCGMVPATQQRTSPQVRNASHRGLQLSVAGAEGRGRRRSALPYLLSQVPWLR